MNAKHTPGPLVVRQPESFPFDIQIVDANGEVVFRESRCAYSTKQRAVEDVMQGYGFPVDQRDAVIAANERQLADMHLRAAAPDLLEALQKISNGQEMTGDFTHAETVLRYQEIARAAIAKATGEPQ